MNRLESIKKRHDSEVMFLNKEEAYVHLRNDIDYLLQRLERYEKALLKYSVMIVVDSEDRPHDVGMVAREALEEEALKEKKDSY